jgi:hypothetical protein
MERAKSAAAPKIKIDLDILIGTFGLRLGSGGPPLRKWLDAPLPALSDDNAGARALLERQRERLGRQGAGWNEEELKMRFLALLFEYIDFDIEGKLRVFFERPLAAVVGQHSLAVKCDCLFAKPFGVNAPERPYFFLQEFKKQKQNEDAEAQMLAAMLIAQATNANGQPVYGAFLQGKNWTFATLLADDYNVSRQYDVTQTDDFEDVVRIMRSLKALILAD